MRYATIAVVAVLLGVAAQPASAQYGGRCMVSDPTGTPLNVREYPQGRVIGSIRNGTYVRLADTRFDNRGRPWAYIVRWESGRGIGWVFREFISCY